MRTVHCEDALHWLKEREVLTGCSIITSMPDFSEFQSFSLPQWKEWFTQAASLILSRCPDDGVSIFFQSDIKEEGTWVDKGFLVQAAAAALGHELLWHKIVCRAPAGTITFGKPSYSHLLCFSRGLRAEVARSTPDVLPETGEKNWIRGMGIDACFTACRHVLEETKTRTVVNPFCGQGSILAVAEFLGLNSIGIEKNAKRAERAKALTLTPSGRSWDEAVSS
ncbi:MAG: SAM-dependent methyltransferase [Methylotenera sp.]|nr:SAM-dependent methyltransferase [Oligoflexia bacterium]